MTDWGQYLSHMRQTAPLIQNITNYVAMNVMAQCVARIRGIALPCCMPKRRRANSPPSLRP